MPYTVFLRDNKTGEIRFREYEFDWFKDDDYTDLWWWTEGNFGCDCNRQWEFQRAGGEEASEPNECGDGVRYAALYAIVDGKRIDIEEKQPRPTAPREQEAEAKHYREAEALLGVHDDVVSLPGLLAARDRIAQRLAAQPDRAETATTEGEAYALLRRVHTFYCRHNCEPLAHSPLCDEVVTWCTGHEHRIATLKRREGD